MSIQVDIEKTLGAFTLRTAFEAGDETLALLGASGCGKSLTLRCIAGVEKPDRGRIAVNGVTLFDSEKRINLSPQKRKAGLLFQHYALFPQMTVRQNIACGLRREIPAKKRGPMVEKALQSYDLAEAADLFPDQLSGGQQQRTALARMMVSAPEIMMLDEPFSALDSHLRFRMEQEVRQVIAGFDRTVILVSHNRDEVYRMADRVAVMSEGRIERIGSRQEVFRDPRTVNACLLTGCKNVSPIRAAGTGTAFAADWGISLRISLREGTDAVGLRMHSIQPGPGENEFRCRVEEVVENPFSVTVMLRPLQAHETSAAIGWETEKDVWEKLKGPEVLIHIPQEALIQLKG